MTKTVLITGASSGFGAATAKLFQQMGWNVIATMRAPEKEQELRALPRILLFRLDLEDKASIRAAVDKGVETFGSIDVLVNNAGYGAIGALEAASDEVIQQQFAVNFFGLIDVMKAVLPMMRKKRSGIVINLSSMGGRITIPFGSLYHATKWALEGLTESLQYELNPLGIRLKLIEPGSYQTNFNGRSLNFFGAGDQPDYQDSFARFTVMAKQPGRGNPDLSEVSTAIYQAATDETDQLRYIVGNDARTLIQTKQDKGDAAFKELITGHFGL